MCTTATLTREISDFINIQDNWVIGFDDSKPGTIGNYVLPDGYYLAETIYGETLIYDRNGDHCEIATHKPTGRPQLWSLAGTPVLKVVSTEKP